MTHLTIHLEPNVEGRHVFYPSQTLNGVIELTLDAVKKFRGCYVVIYGFARAHWTEQRTRTTGTGDNRRSETYTVHYEGKQVFLNSKTYLFGHHGRSAQDVEPGIHRYNFSCLLPDMLPYTLDTHRGNIGYYVEAVLDIPWRFDKETKFPFVIIRNDDLNLYPELRMAQKLDERKTFCCLFCQSGPLMLTVSIPSSGFAGGQCVPVRIEYANRSDVEVLRTNVILRRYMAFSSYTPENKTRTESEKMVEIYTDGVSKNGCVELEKNLEIPIIMMNSNVRFCHVVQIYYCVEVEGVVEGCCHNNIKMQIPITIGSQPIRQDTGFNVGQNNYNFYPQPLPQPSAPFVQTHLPSAPMDDGEEKRDLPPSFEEAMSMAPPQPYTQQQPQSANNLGWNVLEPSLPQKH